MTQPEPANSPGRVLFCATHVAHDDRDSRPRRVLQFLDFLKDAGWTVSFLAAGGLQDVQRQIEELFAHARFDVALIASWSDAERCVRAIRAAAPATRIIVDSGRLDFLCDARDAFQAANRLDASNAARLIGEINAYAAADGVLTVSQKEAELIGDLTGDTSLAYAVPDGETARSHLMAAVGSVLTKSPNAAAPIARHHDREPVKLIAFYRPQFHPIPENDEWCGPGFTDWTDVVQASPQFQGHYQPRLPRDLGFCDLRLPAARRAQADLAREHGIHGFCYDHYWFNGKRLLERPFDEVLRSGEPDFPFCLCWANEPWSRRRADGRAEVLQAQTYSDEDDRSHLRALLPALADRRAIRVEDKPLFLVHRPVDLPNPGRTIATWRRMIKAAGLPGIHLVAVDHGENDRWDPIAAGFDAALLFQPQWPILRQTPPIPIDGKDRLKVYDYQSVWPALANLPGTPARQYETAVPGWDNSARNGDAALVLHNSTPEAFESWLRLLVHRAAERPSAHRLVFVNAWNNWAEGCHLEPDSRSGRAYLEATRRALESSPGQGVNADTVLVRGGMGQ